MKRLSKFLVILLVIMSMIMPRSISAAEETDIQNSIDFEYFRAIMDMIKDKFNDGATDDQLIMGALKGMFGNLDQYTEFYTSEEAQTFFNDVGGEYGGIGISMLKINNYIQVIQVFSDTPAEKAGIISGDRIVTVDGESTNGLEPEDVAILIKGEAGTSVTLEIIKSTEIDISRRTKIVLVRELIKINPVSYDIRNDIAYLKIETFNLNTYENFLKAIEEIDRNGIKKIILDLRNNPGGYVDQAVAVARSFVPEGLITKLDFKSRYVFDIEYYSDLKQLKYKVVVLVNKGTASASEILAGAMQDSKSGILVGTQTYGKAKVQSLLPVLTPAAYSYYKYILGVDIVNAYDLINYYGIVPYEDEVIGWTKMTTGEYVTPLGRSIGNVGLIPYMWIEDPEAVNGVDITGIQKLRKTVKPGLNYMGTDVYNAEKILRIAGYDVDLPDMLMDEKTFEAVKQFQEDKGLYSYGVLDFTTQQTLNKMYEELLIKYDGQYAWAVKLVN